VCTLYGTHHQQQPLLQLEAEPGAAEAAAAAVSSQPAARAVGVCGQGAVVSFNLLRSNGSFVGYRFACLQFAGSLLLLFCRSVCLAWLLSAAACPASMPL
jgi:hypothetical protein